MAYGNIERRDALLDSFGRIFKQGLRGMKVVACGNNREQQDQDTGQCQQRLYISCTRNEIFTHRSTLHSRESAECTDCQCDPDEIEQ